MSEAEVNVQSELKKAKCIQLMNALKGALRAPQNQRILTDEIQAKMFEDLEKTHSEMHTGRPIEVDANEWANWETYKEDVEAFHDHWWAMMSLAAEYGGNDEAAPSPSKSEINENDKNENKDDHDISPNEFRSSSRWTKVYNTTTLFILLYCAITCSYLLHLSLRLRDEPPITDDPQSTSNADAATNGTFQISLNGISGIMRIFTESLNAEVFFFIGIFVISFSSTMTICLSKREEKRLLFRLCYRLLDHRGYNSKYCIFCIK